MIAVIEGCGHNLASLCFAIERLGYDPIVTSDPDIIGKADRVILPGVGHASFAMASLRKQGLVEFIPRLTMPLLGICLGMQLLFESSQEGPTECLGIIPGAVRSMSEFNVRPLPHMGWNHIYAKNPGLLDGYDNYVYFVHSYYVPTGQYTLAWSDYGRPFSAIVNQGNFFGMQFHPEKSSSLGDRLLAAFLERGEL